MKIVPLLTGVVVVAATAGAGFVMCRHLGLIDGLEFGCGQYYYTDIPDWQRYFSVERYHDHLPKALSFVLFFAWGYLMYRLWRWIDSSSDN